MYLRWTALLILLVLGVFLLLRDANDDRPTPDTLQGLPWQITLNADGSSSVFGITLGKSRLADVLNTLGSDMELAIIAAPKMLGSLEMYYGHYRSGLLTGKLVFQTAVPEARLSQWRERAIRQKIMVTGAARKYTLAPDDVTAALQAVVQGITFIPSIGLDEEIVIGRFGEPDQRIQMAEGVTHYLYSALGLDITVSEDVKDVMQYVSPADFDRLKQPLGVTD